VTIGTDPRQFYTQEFKEEAVRLVENGGLTVAEVSRRLSVSQQTLRNWIKKYRQNGSVSAGGRAVTDLEAENSLPGCKTLLWFATLPQVYFSSYSKAF